jgi:hypothetical protein
MRCNCAGIAAHPQFSTRQKPKPWRGLRIGAERVAQDDGTAASIVKLGV